MPLAAVIGAGLPGGGKPIGIEEKIFGPGPMNEDQIPVSISFKFFHQRGQGGPMPQPPATTGNMGKGRDIEAIAKRASESHQISGGQGNGLLGKTGPWPPR